MIREESIVASPAHTQPRRAPIIWHHDGACARCFILFDEDYPCAPGATICTACAGEVAGDLLITGTDPEIVRSNFRVVMPGDRQIGPGRSGWHPASGSRHNRKISLACNLEEHKNCHANSCRCKCHRQ